MGCYYGLAKPQHVRDYARVVCDALGHGVNNVAMLMLIETAAQETHGGQYRDPTPFGAGRGLCQIDLIAFDDVKARARAADVQVLRDRFGVELAAVSHGDLDFSPLLSMIFCRLFYKLIPEVFPRDVEGRAAYWKKYYNTELGAGAAREFVSNVKLFGV